MLDDSKITFKDMIALAKSGWTPKDVNSMIDRFENMNDSISSDASVLSPEDVEAGEAVDTLPAETSSNEVEEASHNNDDKDNKIIELESKIAELEKKNSQVEISSEQKSLDDMIDDIFKEYFN